MLNNLLFNSTTISTLFKNGSVYYCGTDMVKVPRSNDGSKPDYRLGHFFERPETKQLIQVMLDISCESLPDSGKLSLSEIYFTQNNKTWLNEELAIELATCISPEFHYWVIQQVKTLLRTGYVTIEEKQNQDILYTQTQHSVLSLFERQLERAIKDGDERMSDFYRTALAQYSRAKLLNGMVDSNILPEQQFEGVVDVAIRLGIRVPTNLEGSLGKYVKKHAGELLTQVAVDSAGDATYRTDKRFSQASNKVVYANMYPYKHPKVESLVRQYLESKGVI